MSLTRGSIVLVDGTFGVGDLDDQVGQSTLEGDPASAINVGETGTLPNGDRFAVGETAHRTEKMVDVTRIDGEANITQTKEEQTTSKHAEWALVPGEFAVVTEEFAIRQLRFGTPVQDYNDQIRFDLNNFRDTHEDLRPTSFGFSHRGVDEGAQKGSVHGRHLYDDPDIGDELEGGTLVNELRGSFWYETDWGFSDEVCLYLARSGYLDVYEPDMTTEEFLAFVASEVLPVCHEADDD